MSTGYRDQPKWAQNSLKEAEVAHFRKLQGVQAVLDRLTAQVNRHLDEQKAAVDSGIDPAIVMLGHRACGLDAEGNPLPEKSETDAATKEPTKQAKPRLYKPRIYAPPMMALAVRVCEMGLDLAPLIRDQWSVLVRQLGIDPRRLALDADSEAIAALMLDELGIQFHEVGASDGERLRDALNKIEAWIKEAKERKPFDSAQGGGGPEQSGPPEAQAAAPQPPQSEPAPAGDAQAAQAATPSATATEPEATSEPKSPGRDGAPYSASGSSLDWTKL